MPALGVKEVGGNRAGTTPPSPSEASLALEALCERPTYPTGKGDPGKGNGKEGRVGATVTVAVSKEVMVV